MTATFTPASAVEVAYGLALVTEPRWLASRRLLDFVILEALLDGRPYSREPFPLSSRKVADWMQPKQSESWIRQLLKGLVSRQVLALDSVGRGRVESEFYACHPTHWQVRFSVAPEELGRRLALASALANPLASQFYSRGSHRTCASRVVARRVSAGGLAPSAQVPWDPRESEGLLRRSYGPARIAGDYAFPGGSKEPLSEQEQSELRSRIKTLTAAVSHSTGLKTIYGSPRDRIAGLAASANGHWSAVLATAAAARGRLVQDLLDDLEEIARGEHVVAADGPGASGADRARAQERRRLEGDIDILERSGDPADVEAALGLRAQLASLDDA